MSARQRVLALKLLEKQKRNPEFAKKIGIEIKVTPIKNQEIVSKKFI